MLKVLKTALIAGFAITGFASSGVAADLDQPIFTEQAPDYQPVEIGNGWYIRGDIGYAASYNGGTHTFRTFDPVTTLYSPQTFVTNSTDADISVGVGVGYQLNDWFRVDGTVERFSGAFTGTTASTSPCVSPVAVPGYAGTTCASNDAQDYTAYQLMANAYVDLGTYVGVTPYLGAGLGYTVVSYGDLTNSLYCVPGASACPIGVAAIPSVSHAGESDWRLTYSAMAGLGYNLSQNVKLDLGYRYSKIGSGSQFKFDAASIAAGAAGTQGKDAGFDRHEIKVGVRYALW
jgi:opacity protein-like surface antigen